MVREMKQQRRLRRAKTSGRIKKIGQGLLSLIIATAMCLQVSGAVAQPAQAPMKAKDNPTKTAKEKAALCPSHQAGPVVLTKVANDIYVRKGAQDIFRAENLAAIANVGIIIGKTSIAVIDTGGSYCDGKRILTAIRQLSDKPISHVINTHSHPDHVFGNAAFEGESPTFVGHQGLARAMRERGGHYLDNLERLVGIENMAGTKIIPPTREVKTTLTLNLGERPLLLEAHKTAHTNHDLTVFDPQSKILFAGDLLFHKHTPVLDGSLKGWLTLMQDMQKIPAKQVVPGHGGPLLPWPAALKPQQAYFQNLAKDIKAILKSGGTMAEAQQRAGKAQRQSWLLFKEYNARNAAAAFAELEWDVE